MAHPAKDLFIVALFIAFTVQVGSFIVSNSNTFDEPCYIAAGASYIKTGSLELEDEYQPPLQKYLMGLSVSLLSPSFPYDSENLKSKKPFRFGHEFVYDNSVKPELLIAMGRLPSLLLSLVLAAFLFSWAERWFGWKGGAVALLTYIFEPNILAHSGVASMDIGVSCFLFGALYFLFRFFEQDRLKDLLISGLLAGLASATKMTGIFFFSWSAILLFQKTVRTKNWKSFFTSHAVLVLGAFLVLLAVYQVRYIDKYFDLFQNMFQVVFGRHPTEDYPNFLAGRHRVGGWWTYFIVAMAVKTPLPWFVLVGLGSLFTPKEKRTPLLLSAGLLLVICTVAQKQNGLRYFLPAYPLLCLLAGGVGLRLKNIRWLPWASGFLVAWLIIEALSVRANYLTYFNPLAGGPKKGYKWLVDCNLDWGQDYPAVARFLRQNQNPAVVMATFGTADRDYYFGPRQDLLSESNNRDRYFKHINPLDADREWLVISATILQGFGLSDPRVFSWLHKMKPLAQIANSTFIYDISKDAFSQFQIGVVYKRNRQLPFAIRQFQKTARLQPDDPIPHLALGDVYSESGQRELSQRHYKEAWRRAKEKGQTGVMEQVSQKLKS